MTIGVFDSGVGGLTVLGALQQRLPNQSFVYFGDQANAPYGTRSPEDVRDLTQTAVQFLWDQGCDLVILACNTASAIALRPIQAAGVPVGKNVLGVFVPMIEALTERAWGDHSAPKVCEQSVALFATPATVASRAFQRELSLRAMGVDVQAQSCPGLVEAIESGDVDAIQRLVNGFVSASSQAMPRPDTAILACTHYPWAEAVFQEALGTGVHILNQADLVADSLADYLARHPQYSCSSGGSVRYLTTGSAGLVADQAGALLDRIVSFESLSHL